MKGTMCDYTTAEVFTQIVSAAADCAADDLDDFIFRRTSFPPGVMGTTQKNTAQ